MRIHTRIVIDVETGRILADDWYEWDGPVALCDRSLTQAGKQAASTATQVGGEYTGTAQGIGANIIPGLERMTVTPPGMESLDLAKMQTRAQLGAAGATGAAQQAAKLQALRTGNVAAAGAQQTAMAEGGARATGSAIQDILAQNAQLKERQRQMAYSQLGDIYGQSMQGGLTAMGQVPEDISAATQASRTGWLQNLTGVLGTIGDLTGSAGNMIGSLRRR